jgi:hypothetical protein
MIIGKKIVQKPRFELPLSQANDDFFSSKFDNFKIRDTQMSTRCPLQHVKIRSLT